MGLDRVAASEAELWRREVREEKKLEVDERVRIHNWVIVRIQRAIYRLIEVGVDNNGYEVRRHSLHRLNASTIKQKTILL